MAEYQKAIKTPIPDGGMGWYAIDQQEIDAVTRVLKTQRVCSGMQRTANASVLKERSPRGWALRSRCL